MVIEYSPAFARMYRKLPAEIKRAAEKMEVLFRSDIFHPLLKTHKLHGKCAGFYAFSITSSYRIIFERCSDSIIRFHAIGDHKIYG